MLHTNSYTLVSFTLACLILSTAPAFGTGKKSFNPDRHRKSTNNLPKKLSGLTQKSHSLTERPAIESWSHRAMQLYTLILPSLACFYLAYNAENLSETLIYTSNAIIWPLLTKTMLEYEFLHGIERGTELIFNKLLKNAPKTNPLPAAKPKPFKKVKLDPFPDDLSDVFSIETE